MSSANAIRTFKKVLIANRGEIAVRIARTLRVMGISPVAIYSDVDRRAPHVWMADEAYCVGHAPATESYLRPDKIIEVAKIAGVDAIHPGYGFLSENANFAQLVEKEGFRFIGPGPQAITLMGSKTAARARMQEIGIPCIPGSEALKDVHEAEEFAKTIGFPILVKAAAGGGGKGMRLVKEPKELASAFRSAQSEALKSFSDDTVFIEKAVMNPRHVEIQIVSGPDHRTLWLGERECSMQRRHQKIIEETPCGALNDNIRRQMGEISCKLAEDIGYVGVGTVEFLLDEEQNFYFLEMNTRLQVEHPVTELCSGIDLVKMQIRIAEGHLLKLKQKDIKRQGHAIEARIYAEDANHNFIPCPGDIEDLILPAGPGIRVDCGVSSGFEVPRYYDPMIAKISAWGTNREEACNRLDRALSETAVKGITSNTVFLRQLLKTKEFKSGQYHTGTVEELKVKDSKDIPQYVSDLAIIAAVITEFEKDKSQSRHSAQPNPNSASWWRTTPNTWRNR